MPEYIGPIEIPAPVATGTFPLVLDYGSGRVILPQVIVHAFGAAEQQREQRFYVGDGMKRFQVRLQSLTNTEKVALTDFFEARKGAYEPFTLNVVEPDGIHPYIVRFTESSLGLERNGQSLWQFSGEMVEDPVDYPVLNTVNTLNRFPSTALKAALLSQVQRIIPLLVITPVGQAPIYLSDRRVLLDNHLYQPRITDWGGIGQSIDGANDTASFTLGNADRVFSKLVNAIDLYNADIQFSLLHQGTLTKVDLWRGRLSNWSGGASDDFEIQADDGLPLRTSTPTRTILRQGGFLVPEQPVNVGGKKGISRITATSVTNDTAYGKPLKEIFVNNGTYPLPVDCEVIAGRDESEYYAALGIVGAGPISGFYQGANSNFVHSLDGQPWHGYSSTLLGLRRSHGGNSATGSETAADNAPDAGSNYFALDDTSTHFPQLGRELDGVAFLQIRRSDEKGIQAIRPSEHPMKAWIVGGLGCWSWSGSGPYVRTWWPGCTNPIWIALRTFLKAKGLHNATAAEQEAWFDVNAAISCAAICSDLVTPIITPQSGATTETQFKFTGILAEQRPTRDWISDILSSCLGYYTMEFGKIKFGMRYNSSAVEAFTDGNILLDSLQLAMRPLEFNYLTVAFADEEYAYQNNAVELKDDDFGAHIGERLTANVNLPGVSTKSQAARICSIKLREVLGGSTLSEWLKARRVALKTTILALNTEPGMVCSYTGPDAPNGSLEFRVKSWKLNKDWSIDIVGDSTTDSMYDLATGPKPVDVAPDAIPPKEWYPVEVNGSKVAAPPVANLVLALDQSDPAGYRLNTTWNLPASLGSTAAQRRKAMFFNAADAELPIDEGVELATLKLLDEIQSSANDGPFAEWPDLDTWVEVWVALLNGDLEPTWVKSNREKISGGQAPVDPSLGDVIIDDSHVVLTWSGDVLTIESRYAPHYVPGPTRVTDTLSAKIYLEAGETVKAGEDVPYTKPPGENPPANLQPFSVSISKAEIMAVTPAENGSRTLYLHALNVQDMGDGVTKQVPYKEHTLQGGDATAPVVLAPTDIDVSAPVAPVTVGLSLDLSQPDSYIVAVDWTLPTSTGGNTGYEVQLAFFLDPDAVDPDADFGELFPQPADSPNTTSARWDRQMRTDYSAYPRVRVRGINSKVSPSDPGNYASAWVMSPLPSPEIPPLGLRATPPPPTSVTLTVPSTATSPRTYGFDLAYVDPPDTTLIAQYDVERIFFLDPAGSQIAPGDGWAKLGTLLPGESPQSWGGEWDRLDVDYYAQVRMRSANATGTATSGWVVSAIVKVDKLPTPSITQGITFIVEGRVATSQWRWKTLTVNPAAAPTTSKDYLVQVTVWNDAAGTVSDMGGAWVDAAILWPGDMTRAAGDWWPWDKVARWIQCRVAARNELNELGPWRYSGLVALAGSAGIDPTQLDVTKTKAFGIVDGKLQPLVDGSYLVVDVGTGKLTPQAIQILGDYLDGNLFDLIGGKFTITADAVFANLVATAMAIITGALQVGGGASNIQVSGSSIILNAGSNQLILTSGGGNFGSGQVVAGYGGFGSLQVGPNVPYGSIDGGGNAVLAALQLFHALAIEAGGTGASSAAGARSNLGLSPAAIAPFGSAAGEVCQGSDPRLNNARTPTSHRHTVNTTDVEVRMADGTAQWVKVVNMGDPYTGYTGA
ncbi:MAG: phage tail protein [Paludibaculum sp.]